MIYTTNVGKSPQRLTFHCLLNMARVFGKLDKVVFPFLKEDLNVGSNNIHVTEKLLIVTFNLNKYIHVPQN